MTRKVKKVYREGLPRITEPIFAQEGYRDTGFYGTGIYAYRDLEATDQQNEDVYELDVPNLTLLSACLSDLRIVGDKLCSYLEKDTKIKLDSKKHDNLCDALTKIEDMNNDIDFSEDDLRKAIQQSKTCLKTKESTKCSLPINHLFRMKGFHGVYPFNCRHKMIKEGDQWVRKYVVDENSAANSNAYGIVIFKQNRNQIKKISRVNPSKK